MKARAIKIAVRNFIITQAHIKESEYHADKAWCDMRFDSLDFVELVMDLEEAFNVEFPDVTGPGDYEQFRTPNDVIKCLIEKTKDD